MPSFLPPWQLRQSFANRLSEMYRSEVPAYGTLTDLVSKINAKTSSDDQDSGARLGEERHGAIRLASASELSLVCRAFRILGMYPVGYYDLSPAGIPVHSTAFRPVTADEMSHSPFRVFVSLIRIDQIQSDALQTSARALITQRSIMQPEAIVLMNKAEDEGGLSAENSDAFISSLMETFRWRGEAISSHSVYDALLKEHPLLADVVCFPNPHINHLTPRVTDIDLAQHIMKAEGLPAKATIEGPPARKCPILLRQTAFRALEESVRFPDEHGQQRPGTHTARFGEIESRGIALTPDGMALYNNCLAKGEFENIPDNYDDLRRKKLAWFRYVLNDAEGYPQGVSKEHNNIERLIDDCVIRAIPITYEDFLPVSAAGIFQSNLVHQATTSMSKSTDGRADFERALGRPVLDMHDLYRKESEQSLESIFADSAQYSEMADG